jgi:uncharacterized protein
LSREAVIIDTNVIVAGLLTARDASPVARILDDMLIAGFPFVVSEALLAEFRAVLLRLRLRKLHGLSISEVEAILIALAQDAIELTPVAGPPTPDPGDQLLWDLLTARRASACHWRKTTAAGRGHAGSRDFPTHLRVLWQHRNLAACGLQQETNDKDCDLVTRTQSFAGMWSGRGLNSSRLTM